MSDSAHSPAPGWWAMPGEVDFLAIVSVGLLLLVVLGVIHLYARFDRYAEHKSADTPLRTTVPTLLVVALAYEILPPLSHFSLLLPAALILAALARDLMIFLEGRSLQKPVEKGTPDA